MNQGIVVADIGGTNARFGFATDNGSLENVLVLKCSEYVGIQDAYKDYIERYQITSKKLALAVASPVENDEIELTNNHWRFSKRGLLIDLSIDKALIVNDFTAQSLAVIAANKSSFRILQKGQPDFNAPIYVIGPGTGLGVGGLVLDGNGEWIPLSTEGGHVTLVAQTQEEWEILSALQTKFSHVSAERVISGPGLLQLYRTLCELSNKKPVANSTTSMIERVTEDPLIEHSLELFSGFFGVVASNGCLTLGATQGVYIAGGVVPKLGPLFKHDIFMQRFQAKGRFENYLSKVPLKILVDTEAALLGLSIAYQIPALRRFVTVSNG